MSPSSRLVCLLRLWRRPSFVTSLASILSFSLLMQDRADAQWCPPVPPPIGAVHVTKVIPEIAGAGDVIIIEGENFDLLPVSTNAWFYSASSGWTAQSHFEVLSTKHGMALVPSQSFGVGHASLSLYHAETYDCSSQGGGNSLSGNWVNPREAFLNLEITQPSPQPLPASHLTAVATAPNVIQLAWRDNSSNEQGFEILMGPDRSSTSIRLGMVPANQTLEPIDNLSPDTLFCFEVRAFNQFGFHPVPDLAKICARTPPQPRYFGTVKITDVSGYENSLCASTLRAVPLFAWEDSDNNGIVDYVGLNALAMPAPAAARVNINHSPPWEILVANRYASGANLVVMATIQSCGPNQSEFVAVHLHLDAALKASPVFFSAGNYLANNGPGNEGIGTVMIADEFDRKVHYDVSSGSLTGYVRAMVGFEVSIPPNGPTFSRRANVELNFEGGVRVVRE